MDRGVRHRSTTLVDRVDEVKGKVGDALREHLGRRDAQPPAHRARSATSPLAVGARRPRGRAVGPRRRSTSSSTRCSSGCCATGCTRRSRRHRVRAAAADAPAAGRFDVAVVDPRAGRGRRRGWPGTWPSAGPVGVAISGTWGSGTGDLTGARARRAAAAARCDIDPRGSTAADDRRSARWLADESRPKVLHDAKGPMLALAAHGLDLRGLTCDTALAAYLALPGQRTFDLADLVAALPHRELRMPSRRRRPARRFDGADDAEAPRALGIAGPGDRRSWPRPWTRDLSRARRRPGCCAEVELPLVARARRDGADRHRRRPRLFAAMEAEFGGEVKRPPRRRLRGRRRSEFNLGSPKQLQEILFVELGLPKTKRIKTGYTTDADALAGLLRADRAPAARRTCCATATSPGCGSTVEGLHQGGRRRRPHPHHLQPDHRGHRPAVVDRPEPAEHPDPHRRGPPDPAGLRRRRRATKALLTADYSQIEMRIMAHLSEDEALIGRVRSRGTTSTRRPRPGCSTSRPSEVDARDARQDQGDELRPRLRAVRLRAVAAARHSARRGPRAHGRVLRAVRRRPRLPRRRRRPGPARTATPRPSSAAAATCPTSPATTASAARWPSAWRSTPRSRARPPTSSRSPCSTSHARAARRLACAPGCCSRSTTSSSSRWRRASGTPCESWCRAMGGAADLAVPLDVSMGGGRTWEDAAH